MTRLGWAAALTVAILATACSGPTPEVTAAPTDAFLEPAGDPATGPLGELGAGSAFESDWRFGIYPTDAGWCLQLAVDDVVSARCDDLVPEDEAAFGSVGVRTSEATGVTIVDGIVTEEVATVWVIGESQGRLPAQLFPLTDWEVDGQAFLGFAPAEMRLTHVMAVAWNGAVLETYELP